MCLFSVPFVCFVLSLFYVSSLVLPPMDWLIVIRTGLSQMETDAILPIVRYMCMTEREIHLNYSDKTTSASSIGIAPKERKLMALNGIMMSWKNPEI